MSFGIVTTLQTVRSWVGGRGPQQADQAHEFYQKLAQLSREPRFYQAPYSVPDTLEGRFDILSLIVGTCCLRLSQLPDGQILSQSVFDIMFKHMERNFREAGVGDLSVPKYMRRLIQAFYGRNQRYASVLLSNEPDKVTPFTSVLAFNLYGSEQPELAAPLTHWLVERWWEMLNNCHHANDLKRVIDVVSKDI